MSANPKFPGALFPALALVLWAVPPVLAQAETEATGRSPAPAATNPGPSPAAELARLGAFLDQHPAIEARLRENAALLNDPVFLKNHPQLGTYLTNHPKVQTELAVRPRWFIHRELARPTPSPAPANPKQVAEFDKLLDQHPELATQLAQHPQLLRQPQFLNSHPVLRDYVKQHPELVRPAAPKAAAPNTPAQKAANPPAAKLVRPPEEKAKSQP